MESLALAICGWASSIRAIMVLPDLNMEVT
jgi:hypothetical protein